MNYIYLHNNTTGTGNGQVIDILGAYQDGQPPVLHTFQSSTSSYVVEASHDQTNWKTYLSATTAEERDLIPGIRWWRVRLIANGGLFTALVGPVTDKNGKNISPRYAINDVVPVP